MTQPLVSIIITNYNYGCYVSKAIASGLSQTYPHVEVIVVDDGSTDNSREIIASYGDRILSVLKENGGQASAFNAGFAASQGDIICFLDSDDQFKPAKVAEVVEAFESDRDLGWCFHYLTLVDAQTFLQPNTDPSIQITPKVPFKIIDFRADIKNAKLPTFVPSTSGLCFSRSLLEQILPMPESEGVSLSDLYIKYAALGLSKGCVIDSELGIQGIHADNAYTGKTTIDKLTIFTKIDIVTAYWMRVKFPELVRMANKLLARGLGGYSRIRRLDSKYEKTMQDYLNKASLGEKLGIYSQGFYYSLKFWLRPS
jgi:glycosyltransferase involved in cell wall biosynthesis